MSTAIEHKILFVAFVSVSWKWYFDSISSDSTAIKSIFLTLFATVSLYVSYAIERNWTSWICEKPNFWTHQLKTVNRSPQNLGVWCTTLPLWIGFLTTFSSQSRDFRLIAIIFMVNCPLTLRFILVCFVRKLKSSALITDAISILVAIGLLRSIFSITLLKSIPLSILPTVANRILVPKLMTMAARSFTLGEFHLIYSGGVLALMTSINRIRSAAIINEFDSISLLLAWSLITCVAFGTLCLLCSIIRRSAVAFWLALFINVLSAYLLCLFLNGFDMLSWTADFLIFGGSDQFAYDRWTVLTFWLLCVACTIRFAIACWSMPRLGTVHRKFFHLTIGLVVVSGLLFDGSLVFFASVLMFDGFVILEIIRLCDVEPIGMSVREVFAKFLDHQDQGPLVLTPIYLLIACFVPIWIDFSINGLHITSLRHFSGLVAVGVGDAAAAIGGTYFGRTSWKVVNSRKTVQGTAFCFVAQTAIVFCILHWIGTLSMSLSFGKIAWIVWSCFLLSVLETFSAQVDNLILPLFMYLLFFTW